MTRVARLSNMVSRSDCVGVRRNRDDCEGVGVIRGDEPFRPSCDSIEFKRDSKRLRSDSKLFKRDSTSCDEAVLEKNYPKEQLLKIFLWLICETFKN